MTNNTFLDSIVSLLGCEDFLIFMDKYKLYQETEENITIYKQCKENPEFYDGVSFRDRVYEPFEHYFSDDLIDLLEKMIRIDP